VIDLSKKAASRFGFKWDDLLERTGDHWKVDIMMVERVPMLLIVHAYTLFTLVRRKSDSKTVEGIADEIRRCCPWYRHVGRVTAGKNSNRRLTGSITEIKRNTWGLYSPEQINAMEMRINNCLFSYLSKAPRDYGTPFEAVEKYARGLWP